MSISGYTVILEMGGFPQLQGIKQADYPTHLLNNKVAAS